jgi:fructokinase
MEKKIVCFGEMLWDMLPTGKMAGGAPMNVAIHLKYQGFNPIIISRVGTDDFGIELIDFLKEKKVITEFVQLGQKHLTGVVKANISDKKNVTYNILHPVAYDYIQLTPEAETLVKNSDVFIYGSLAARNEVSQTTLLSLLGEAKLKVFDVNLRIPHYTTQTVIALIEKANILKVNEKEIVEIQEWFGEYKNEEESMAFLMEQFDLEMVILTKGDKGAAVLRKDRYYEHPGYSIVVEDTIGSGDAFLATFLAYFLQNQSIDICLKNACKIGALVASCKGATPYYESSDIELLIQENYL